MKKRVVFVIVLLLSIHPAFAQIQDLLSDPHITWVAETELEYDFEPEYLQSQGIPDTDRRYEYRVRKYDFDYCNDAGSFTEMILKLAESNQLPVYKNREDTRQLSKSEVETIFFYTDTVNIYFPEDNEESFKVVK